MAAWSDVKDQIAFRLNRPNYPRPVIQLAAEEVAQKLSSEGLFPQEQTDTTITTNPGQFFYLLARGIVEIRMVRLMLGGGVWIPLTRARSYEDILIADPIQPPFTAIPSTAKTFGRLLRIWPTPNAQYPLEVTVERRVDVPTDDTDTQSFWCDEGRMLMINAACAYIAGTFLHQPDWAQGFLTAASEAQDSLDVITNVRNGPHLVVPHL